MEYIICCEGEDVGEVEGELIIILILILMLEVIMKDVGKICFSKV